MNKRLYIEWELLYERIMILEQHASAFTEVRTLFQQEIVNLDSNWKGFDQENYQVKVLEYMEFIKKYEESLAEWIDFLKVVAKKYYEHEELALKQMKEFFDTLINESGGI